LCLETGGFNESISSGGIYGYMIKYIYISLSLFILCIGVVYFFAMQSNQLQRKYSKKRKRVVAGHPVCGCQAERSYCAMGSAQVPWRQPDPIGFMLKGETIANHFWKTWHR